METQRLSLPQVLTNQNQADMRDLGFGSVVAQESRQRLLNRDGSFNVMRAGLGFLASLSPYHALLTMSWRRFFGLTAFLYFGANLIFAVAYLLCGPGALSVAESAGIENHFLRAFFFSVHTLATIGWGEFLVLLTGFDETFSQTVHARSSYQAEEVVWNARFADIFNRPADDGLLTIDVRKLHSIELIETDRYRER